ncbi:hypothetical protein RS030_162563 [Cryptosporidium xiaoi]|uniref:Signal peptide-containing protein n=1 Tax=Cryptosporidium xiaoi TaxID=659607 RepID=A0AAV9Y0Z1_9CRYT
MLFFRRDTILLLFFTILSSIFTKSFELNSVVFYQTSFVKLRSAQESLSGQSTQLTKKECIELENLFLEILILKNSLRFWLMYTERYSKLNERETNEELKGKYSVKEEKGEKMVLKYSKEVNESLDKYDEILKLLFECLELFGKQFHPYSIIKKNKKILKYVDFY